MKNKKTNFIFVALGNPGKDYELSRHNTGRIILNLYLQKNKVVSLKYDKKTNSLHTEYENIIILFPETFMNKSGEAIKKIITSKQKANNLVVLHDDIDLPLGKFKISYNRGSAGHKGVESIINALKTKEFTRVRIGISPKTPSGKTKKLQDKNLLQNFKKDELHILNKISKDIFNALELIRIGEREKAMNKFN